MRTTLTIDDDVALLLREEAARQGLPFKQVSNRTLRLGLRAGTCPAGRQPYRTRARLLGLRPGIDPDKMNQLYDEMETEDHQPGPPHSHDSFEETVHGLTGVVTYTVDGAAVEVGPGQALCIPPGAVHAFANRGAADARLLAVASPGVFGAAYFREIGAVLAEAAGGPPDRARVADVMRRHGLTPAVSNR